MWGADGAVIPTVEDGNVTLFIVAEHWNGEGLGWHVAKALAPAEKKYWHPHAYEILAGFLIMPGVPFTEELQHLRSFLPSWGKTWHTWPDPAFSMWKA